jgi:hypothetical protein
MTYITDEAMQEMDYDYAQARMLSGDEERERYVSETDYDAVERDLDLGHFHGEHDEGNEEVSLGGGYTMTVRACYTCSAQHPALVSVLN